VAAAELIRLRYPATCAGCGGALPRGLLAHWDKAAKTVTCETCIAAGGQAGGAGKQASRAYESGVAGFDARHGGPPHSNALGELLLSEAALDAPVHQ